MFFDQIIYDTNVYPIALILLNRIINNHNILTQILRLYYMINKNTHTCKNYLWNNNNPINTFSLMTCQTYSQILVT